MRQFKTPAIAAALAAAIASTGGYCVLQRTPSLPEPPPPIPAPPFNLLPPITGGVNVE